MSNAHKGRNEPDFGFPSLEFTTDRPLHEVAAEMRRTAAEGQGLRAVLDFARATAVVVDPAQLVATFAEKSGAGTADEMTDRLLPYLAKAHDVYAYHVWAIQKLATAYGELIGAEGALKSAGHSEEADVVADAHLAAADAFFESVIGATTPGAGNPYPDLETALEPPVRSAKNALKKAGKQHRRQMPTASAALRGAAAALL